jgi:SAM-dependent methyltransferase
MVAETDVILAYRFLMGREPESLDVIKGHANAHATIEDLRREFISSPEFRERAGAEIAAADTGHKSLNWPPAAVDVDMDKAGINRIFERIQAEFADLGETEPHWSVVTEDRFKAENIADTEEHFFESGKGVVEQLGFAAARCGVDLSSYRSCFELGCGLGRSTIWLAEQFETVYAGDISPLHLDYARRTMNKFDRTNVTLFLLNDLAPYEELPSFDVFFSIIVLQHNPPPMMKVLLGIILEKLNPGGIAYFQIPTYALNYQFAAENYLTTVHPAKSVEVHCLPQRELFKIISQAGCEILEIREDGAVGAASISNRILVRKS